MKDQRGGKDLKVVRTYAEAKECAPTESVLIEVPGEFARQIVWLANMLKNPDNSQAGQLVRQLLSTAKARPE